MNLELEIKSDYAQAVRNSVTLCVRKLQLQANPSLAEEDWSRFADLEAEVAGNDALLNYLSDLVARVCGEEVRQDICDREESKQVEHEMVFRRLTPEQALREYPLAFATIRDLPSVLREEGMN